MLNEKKLSVNKSLLEEVVLLMVLVLSLIGMGVTDFSPLESYHYWILMILLFALGSFGLGWSRQEHHGRIVKALLVRQLIHWGAPLIHGVGSLSFAPHRAFEL